MDPRLSQAPAVTVLGTALVDRLGAAVTGLYVGGSLATGDYRPGVSDLDAVALVDARPGPGVRAVLIEVHQEVERDAEGGAALHCVYVPRADAADRPRPHWTWAFGELFRRELSGVARAELLADPVVVHGPPPASWLPPMESGDLRDAARAELAGYWTRALRKRAIWRQDVYVDIGLTTWARAEATLREGRLITKSEAIARLAGAGLPAEVVAGVALRRQGGHEALDDAGREARARTVRAFLATEIVRLLELSEQP